MNEATQRTEDHPQAAGRLRRVIAFPLTLLVIEAALLVASASLASLALHHLGAPGSALHMLGAAGVAVCVAGTFAACQRWIERSDDSLFALAPAPRELAAGLALGFGLFAAAALGVALLGGLDILGLRGMGQVWSMLAMAVVSGVFEETLFRGVLFRQIEAMLGSWAALAITAVLFGAAHLANPDSNLFAAGAIMIEAGILLGAAYLLTRRLWLPIGLHAAWNLTQGWVFSLPVSGGAAPLGLLVTRRTGPEWLTGGSFGLEASVIAILVATLAGVLILSRAISQGRLVAPMWRSARTTRRNPHADDRTARNRPADPG